MFDFKIHKRQKPAHRCWALLQNPVGIQEWEREGDDGGPIYVLTGLSLPFGELNRMMIKLMRGIRFVSTVVTFFALAVMACGEFPRYNMQIIGLPDGAGDGGGSRINQRDGVLESSATDPVGHWEANVGPGAGTT